jgi:5-hydroxyisourate hydrolase-like protein (transthyretin family)
VLLSRLIGAALCTLPLYADAVAGRVLEDHSGAPLPRTEVRLFQPDGPGTVAEAETDAAGHFGIQGLAAGEYRLQFSKANYSGATLRLHTSPNTGALTLRLVRYGAISGRVIDSENQPVRSAQVVAVLQSTASSTSQTVSYNSDGAFRIYGLAPGRYRLAVLSASEGNDLRRGAIWNPREFVVAGGEEYTGADFVVPSSTGFSVSGKLNMPEPVRTMSVALVAADHPGLRVAMGITRPDGSFRFDHILDGAYDLLASSPPNFGRTRIVVESRAVEDVSVPVTPGRTVILRPAGECAEGATATLTAVENWLPDIRITAPLHPPNPVTLEHVAPSRFLLSVKSPRGHCYGSTGSGLDFTGETSPGEVEVALGPTGSIHGRLTGEARAAEFEIVLIEGGSLMQVALPDGEGRFRFDDLAPGAYSVTAHKTSANARWMQESGRTSRVIEVSGGAPTTLDLRQFR